MRNKIIAVLAALSFGVQTMAQFKEISPLVIKNTGKDKSYREGFRLPCFPVGPVTIDGWMLTDIGDRNTPTYFGVGVGLPLWINKDTGLGVTFGWSGHPESFTRWRKGEYSVGAFFSFKL